jgi:hypothetical protein
MGISRVPAMAVTRAPELKFVRIADKEATRTIGALTFAWSLTFPRPPGLPRSASSAGLS